MSRAAKGNPYDNAKAERFFRMLKMEEVYNTKRLHSALGYLPPSEFEAGYAHLKFMG